MNDPIVSLLIFFYVFPCVISLVHAMWHMMHDEFSWWILAISVTPVGNLVWALCLIAGPRLVIDAFNLLIPRAAK